MRMDDDHESEKFSCLCIGKSQKWGIRLLVKEIDTSPKRVFSFRNTFQGEHSTEFPRSIRVPTIFAAEVECGGLGQAWHEHESRAAIGPLILVKIPVEERGRTFFLNDFIGPTDRSEIIDVFFASASCLR